MSASHPVWARRARFALLCFAVLLAAAPVRADAALAAKIDRLFSKWDRPDSPGAIVAVARDGQTVHARGYGMANLEHAIPLSAETVSESGSVAKQFTAAAVALLHVRGRLSLEDPVRKHLPELSAGLADGITVRMLLNHTSGLRDIHGLYELMGRPSYSSFHTNAEALAVVARQRDLNFRPGAEYMYSNAGYIVAAMVVERVTRESFGAFCLEHVFKPRGMMATRWRDDFTAIVPGRAAGYEPRPAGGYRIDMPYSNLVGNGGLLTTVGDLLKWNASFDQPAGEWGEVTRLLQTPSRLNSGRTINYALGLTVEDFAGVQEVGHGGATSGYRTYLARYPERKLSVALLANTADLNSASLAHAVARAALDLPSAARPAAAQAPADLASYAGLYHSAQTDALIELTWRDGRLVEGGAELSPQGPGEFALGGATVKFAAGATAPRKFTLTTANGGSEFVARPKVKPAASELAGYAGRYRSDELDVFHAIEVRGGKLVLSRWPGPALAGEPTFADGFWFGRVWHATFERDASGGITGYLLTNSSGRCRRLRFLRQ